jgi:predicted phosphodiesterase
MRYAILSDVHGRRHKLEAVLADARARNARQILSLGDVGGEECLTLLREACAEVVFGNYEVSGWQSLEARLRDWVRDWPALLALNDLMAVHAVPWLPEGLRTVTDLGRWLKRTGHSWRALFPYVTEDEEILWRVLAELEVADKRILFHGHTHRQAIWVWEPPSRLRRLRASATTIKFDCHYVVGVGSVGLPEDGCWAAYALYDTAAARVELVRLAAPKP